MRQLMTTVTRKGQVTVPVEIRREMGIKEGDRVTFVVDEAGIHFKRGESVVARTAGLFKGRGPRLSAEQLREIAELGFVEHADRREEE